LLCQSKILAQLLEALYAFMLASKTQDGRLFPVAQQQLQLCASRLSVLIQTFVPTQPVIVLLWAQLLVLLEYTDTPDWFELFNFFICALKKFGHAFSRN
jgi:hypothetical protein